MQLNQEECIEKLLQEEVVIIETDTLPGFSCLFNSIKGQQKILRLKQSLKKENFGTIVSDLQMAERYGIFDEFSLELGAIFWPYALIIVPATDPTRNTIGIRITYSPALKQIIEGAGAPICSTSINISGESPCTTLKQTFINFPLPFFPIDIPSTQQSSTIINITANPVQILRSSSINMKKFQEICEKYHRAYQIIS